MTTYNYIDPTLGSPTSLPATYVPPGNLIAVSAAQSGGTTLTAANAATYVLLGQCAYDLDADVLSGYFTAAGNATVIPVGFAPSKVQVINWTDTKIWTWLRGAPATDSLYEVASADPTVDTNSQILVTADAAGGLGDVSYVTLGATLCTNAKVLSFRIEM